MQRRSQLKNVDLNPTVNYQNTHTRKNRSVHNTPLSGFCCFALEIIFEFFENIGYNINIEIETLSSVRKDGFTYD